MLEPYEGKLSSTVLRGGSGSDAADLLDKLFGQEVNKVLLIEFLNDLLVGERHVADISFMDKEIMPESLGGRVVILQKKRTNVKLILIVGSIY